MSIRSIALLIAATGLIASAQVASGGLVRVDFNDLALGDLYGQAGGTGVSGTWGAYSGRLNVVSGDLTAPVSTNFEITQSGTAQKIGSSQTTRYSVTRSFTDPLTGDVWFSFLVAPTAGGRGGIDLDGTRILAVGTTFRVLEGGITDTSVSGAFTAGVESLVLGKVEIDAGPNDEDYFYAWVNPDVRDLGAPTLSVTNSDWVEDSQLDGMAVEVYSSTSSFVDLVSLSDGAYAYADVTGIPEPSTVVMLLGLGAAALVGFLRRRRG